VGVFSPSPTVVILSGEATLSSFVPAWPGQAASKSKDLSADFELELLSNVKFRNLKLLFLGLEDVPSPVGAKQFSPGCKPWVTGRNREFLKSPVGALAAPLAVNALGEP